MIAFCKKLVYIFLMKRISASQQIRQRIASIPPGEPFTPKRFLDLAARGSVDQALFRLAASGVIQREMRGVYVRPVVNRFVGKVPVQPEKILSLLARSAGEVIQVHGASAAQQLGLSTQMPLKPVFLTSGRSRTIHLKGMDLSLKHTSLRKIHLAGTPAGLAITAIWYLGKAGVTSQTIRQIHAKIGDTEYGTLKDSVFSLPDWARSVINSYEQDCHA